MDSITVIVSAYTEKRIEDVKKCLESIEKQSRKPEEVLLILDPIKELKEFYEKNLKNLNLNLKILISDSFGLSNARNMGIKQSRGNIIVFIDDDAFAEKDWLKNILKNFSEKDIWIVGGKTVPVFEEKRPKWFPEELDWIVGCTYKGMPDYKTEIRNPIGANMAFRREVFEKVGFFETFVGRFGKKLLGSEETELCLRLKNKYPEVKIIYDPAAIVYHKVPKERTRIGYVLKRAYYEGISKAILSNKFKLKDEKNYLKFLFKSLGRYLIHFELSKCFTIILVILATITGFLVQKIKSKLQGILEE